jgi:hypothetical protein
VTICCLSIRDHTIDALFDFNPEFPSKIFSIFQSRTLCVMCSVFQLFLIIIFNSVILIFALFTQKCFLRLSMIVETLLFRLSVTLAADIYEKCRLLLLNNTFLWIKSGHFSIRSIRFTINDIFFCLKTVIIFSTISYLETSINNHNLQRIM